ALDERPIEGLLLLELLVGRPRTRRRRRNEHGLDDLARLEVVLPGGVVDRLQKELLELDRPLALWVWGHDLDRGVVGDERRRGRRRVDADADQARVEDRVEAVLAVLGKAVVAALLAAVEIAAAVVPAAGPLGDVAAQGRHVADLGRRGAAGGVRERGVELLELRMIGNAGERRPTP